MENFVIFTLIMMLLICNSKGAGFCEVEERSMVCDGTIPQEYFGDEDMNFPDVDRFEGSNIHTERMYFPTSNFPKLEYIDIKQSSLRCEDIVTQAIVIIEDSECPRSSSSLPTTDLTTLTEETTLKIESQTSDLSSIRPTTDHPSSSHKIPDATSTITLKFSLTSNNNTDTFPGRNGTMSYNRTFKTGDEFYNFDYENLTSHSLSNYRIMSTSASSDFPITTKGNFIIIIVGNIFIIILLLALVVATYLKRNKIFELCNRNSSPIYLRNYHLPSACDLQLLPTNTNAAAVDEENWSENEPIYEEPV